MKLFQFQTNQKGVFLTLLVSESVPTYIHTDENRLKQIIINLVGNAIKFTSKGGVAIKVTENLLEYNSLDISVIDTGIGIKEEDKSKLFQMFGKLEDSESVNTNGVGLGLTISNALAVMLSGKKEGQEIRVTSQYGKGSIFSFSILKDLISETSEGELIKKREHSEQLNDEDEGNIEDFELLELGERENVAEISTEMGTLHSKLVKYKTSENINIFNLKADLKANSPSKANVNQKETFVHQPEQEINTPEGIQVSFPKKASSANCINNLDENNCILIVDDNPFNLLVATNLVKETGYMVKTAIGGHEAIKRMEEFSKAGQNIKVILMDCQMPVIDGYETSKILIEMMSQGKVTKVPILALTANNSKEDIKRCYESGMVGHLTKPTSKKALTQALLNLQ